MSHSIFGWSYPPGCSGPPEYPDPSPESEEAYSILEDAGVDQAIIDKVCGIIDKLAEKAADNYCLACEKRAVEAEAEAEKAAQIYEGSISCFEAMISLCPHGADPIDCNSCLIAADRVFDAARDGWAI